jgi:hypothetical protein
MVFRLDSGRVPVACDRPRAAWTVNFRPASDNARLEIATPFVRPVAGPPVACMRPKSVTRRQENQKDR